MFTWLRPLSALSLVLLLSCCAQGTRQESGKHDHDERMIGELEEKPMVFRHTVRAAATREVAMEHYRAYLAGHANTQYRAESLRRLAALMLEEGDSLYSRVNKQQKTAGEKMLLASIAYYRAYFEQYPQKEDNDAVLYQLARGYELVGDTEQLLLTMDALVANYPDTDYFEEVQFRRGEILYAYGDYEAAEEAYESIVSRDTGSTYQDKAQYKLAWSRFKQEEYVAALDVCVTLLDRMQLRGKLTDTGVEEGLDIKERNFINDILRVVSLSATYTNGTETIRSVMARKGHRQYEPLIYRNLAENYLAKERTVDAAEVFLDYTNLYPETLLAAKFHALAIDAYASGNFADLLLSAKADFVNRYGFGSVFWKQHGAVDKRQISEKLKQSIRDLATHYHALAAETGLSSDYRTASMWYEKYVRSFPQDSDAPRMNFLLAEALHDAGQYRDALAAYIETAYAYETHADSAEAGYAAVLTFSELLGRADRQPMDDAATEAKSELERDALENSIRFCNRFRDSEHAPGVVASTAEKLFENGNYRRAVEFARSNAHIRHLDDKSWFRTTWLIYAHSLFELHDYQAAETAYRRTLELVNNNDPLRRDLLDRLAASIYMQGRQQRDLGQYELASYHFLRIGNLPASSTILATAQYDAAAMQIRLQDWDEAARLLETFRGRFQDDTRYTQDVSEKLILVYMRAGKTARAAQEMLYLSRTAENPEVRRGMAWQAAETYQDIGMDAEANRIYIAYLEKYAQPFPQFMEAHQRVIDYYRGSGDVDSLERWQLETVKAGESGKGMHTDRTRFIAGSAALELAGKVTSDYKQVKLTVPLKKSLANKKSLMQQALQSYSGLMQYGIADITTESTWHVADIYGHFARALLDSQRPQNLNAEEREQYDILLEEQAYPFEEKAIDMHTSNAERTREGLYDQWIRKSIEALSVLQPARYAKTERIEDHVAGN